jgi:hypothetical protein
MDWLTFLKFTSAGGTYNSHVKQMWSLDNDSEKKDKKNLLKHFPMSNTKYRYSVRKISTRKRAKRVLYNILMLWETVIKCLTELKEVSDTIKIHISIKAKNITLKVIEQLKELPKLISERTISTPILFALIRMLSNFSCIHSGEISNELIKQAILILGDVLTIKPIGLKVPLFLPKFILPYVYRYLKDYSYLKLSKIEDCFINIQLLNHSLRIACKNCEIDLVLHTIQVVTTYFESSLKYLELGNVSYSISNAPIMMGLDLGLLLTTLKELEYFWKRYNTEFIFHKSSIFSYSIETQGHITRLTTLVNLLFTVLPICSKTTYHLAEQIFTKPILKGLKVVFFTLKSSVQRDKKTTVTNAELLKSNIDMINIFLSRNSDFAFEARSLGMGRSDLKVGT